METPRHVPELVHVLRHSFRPSDQLRGALENFIPPESTRRATSVEIKSLGTLALDAVLNAGHRYSLQLTEARRVIERSQGQSLAIAPDIEVQNVNAKTVDILMGVYDNDAMDKLVIATRNKLKTAIFTPSEAGDTFSVFARVRSSVPFDDEFQEQALAQYYKAYRLLGPKRLMNIIPEGINGKDEYRSSSYYSSLEEIS